MRRLILGVAAASLAIPFMSSPSLAQYDAQYGANSRSGYDEPYDKPGKDRAYDAYEEAAPAQDVDPDPESRERPYGGDTWQGADGQLYCRRSDGTTGTIIGAGVGALIGRGIDSHGNRGAGTILGAVAGALLGRAVERSNAPVRCE